MNGAITNLYIYIYKENKKPKEKKKPSSLLTELKKHNYVGQKLQK